MKGLSPVFPDKERVDLLRSLKPVNDAVLGYHGDRLKIIKVLKPDVLVLGPDPWDREEIERGLRERGLRTEVVQIGEVYSSSKFYRTSQVIDYIIREYRRSR